MELNTAATATEYMMTSVEVSSASEIKIRNTGAEEEWYGFSALKSGVDASITEGENGNICLPVGTYDFYLAVDGVEPGLWIQSTPCAHVDGDGDGLCDLCAKTMGDITYTITMAQDWIATDGCVLLAWAWGTTDSGSWHAVEYVQETDQCVATLVLPVDYTGAIIVRFPVGTTVDTAVWDVEGVNYYYNKTGDIDLTQGENLTATMA